MPPGTGRGVKTKSKTPCTEIDSVTGKTAFWKSAALGGVAVYDIDNNDFIRVREVDFGFFQVRPEIIIFVCSARMPNLNSTDEFLLFRIGIVQPDFGSSYFSVDPIGTLNPYELNQAETICWESNLDGPKGGFNGQPDFYCSSGCIVIRI